MQLDCHSSHCQMVDDSLLSFAKTNTMLNRWWLEAWQHRRFNRFGSPEYGLIASALVGYMCWCIQPSRGHNTIVHVEYRQVEHVRCHTSYLSDAALTALSMPTLVERRAGFALFAERRRNPIKLATGCAQSSSFFSKVFRNQII
jgi:hypothetical protein